MANKRIDQFDTATPEGDEWLLIQDPVTLGYNKVSASSLTSATSYTKIEVDTSLAGKAELVHVHAISDVTGLQSALDSKSATNHTHTAADVTDFDTEVSNNTDVAANTAARHTHANKTLLDTYSQTEVNLADAVAKKHTHANSAVLNATTASFTTADETKLDGIAAGAQVNTVTSVNGQTGVVVIEAGNQDLSGYATTSALTSGLSNKANVGHTHIKTDITDFPTLATVAISGSYADLTDKPAVMQTVAFVQDIEPTVTQPSIWVETEAGVAKTLWIVT